MNQALETTVFARMIGMTWFGIFLTPVFFSSTAKFLGEDEHGSRNIEYLSHEMRNLNGLLVSSCGVGAAPGSYREYAHHLSAAFTTNDYGQFGQLLAFIHNFTGALWAEMAKGLLIILAIYFFGRWRTRQNELELRSAKEAAENAKEAAELARQNAETANRAKTAFLANMSHELRTPLNGILGHAQVLLRRPNLESDAEAKLRTILASGEHLLEMINEVLDLSRVESGKASVHPRSFELPKFIAGIVDEFQPRATHEQLRFIHEIQGELPRWIETDPLRLRQVLYNLLGNAVKFTPRGEISFRVCVTSKQLRFEVKDTGQGIPLADLSSIFKPFYQAGNNQRIGHGVGLGLYISKQIVELLGGRISVDSRLGRGSAFIFEIPRRDASPISPNPTSPQIIGYEGPRRRILAVDDEPLSRSMLCELLATVGFDVIAADSTEQALLLLKDRFDAVISDIGMPGCCGHILCRRLRSSDATRDLIVIASSGSVFAEDERLALAAGFNGFLPKPVMEGELFEILGRHLELNWIYDKPFQSHYGKSNICLPSQEARR
jgi:signal transduction histidine kinase/ActR/RegA family two-component response regulator